MGRRSSGIHHRFPRGIHITHYHSQSIACWPFLSRDSQPHLPNSSFLRLRSGSFAPQLPDCSVPCRSDLGMASTSLGPRTCTASGTPECYLCTPSALRVVLVTLFSFSKIALL